MNSYQRRLRDIEFYRQRGKDLEAYIMQLLEDREKAGIKPTVPMPRSGIEGDQIMTDVSSGYFFFHLCLSGQKK